MHDEHDAATPKIPERQLRGTITAMIPIGVALFVAACVSTLGEFLLWTQRSLNELLFGPATAQVGEGLHEEYPVAGALIFAAIVTFGSYFLDRRLNRMQERERRAALETHE
jgi:hypothetical protein